MGWGGIKPLLTGTPDRLADKDFSQTPDLSYLAIDFHYLHFDLQMKVNAGGCTHQLKLDVDSIFNIFISAY